MVTATLERQGKQGRKAKPAGLDLLGIQYPQELAVSHIYTLDSAGLVDLLARVRALASHLHGQGSKAIESSRSTDLQRTVVTRSFRAQGEKLIVLRIGLAMAENDILSAMGGFGQPL